MYDHVETTRGHPYKYQQKLALSHLKRLATCCEELLKQHTRSFTDASYLVRHAQFNPHSVSQARQARQFDTQWRISLNKWPQKHQASLNPKP